ncbi:MAG: hypothetical protein CV087_21750 [Candidatus Brocadia sp. WS118]|nr:MAG: hypothetical protein CV087_21750 [Candidatus Brocadia sp. WS118]
MASFMVLCLKIFGVDKKDSFWLTFIILRVQNVSNIDKYSPSLSGIQKIIRDADPVTYNVSLVKLFLSGLFADFMN